MNMKNSQKKNLLRISNLKCSLTQTGMFFTALMACNLDKKPLVLQIFIDGGTGF